MNVGLYIKKLRTEKGLSQEELGKIVGVQKSAVHKWESGIVQNLKKTTIQKLSSYFSVPAENFISGPINSPLQADPSSISRYYRSIIAENLKKIRQDKNLNMFEAAEKIGISETTYSNIERGSCNIAFGTLILIAEAFNVSLDDLISRDAKNYSNITNEEKTLLNKYRMLSLSGKDRANGYIDDLLKVSEYKIPFEAKAPASPSDTTEIKEAAYSFKTATALEDDDDTITSK